MGSMLDGVQKMRSEAERLAVAAIAKGGRLLGLTDQTIIEIIIRQYFLDLAAAGRRHLVDVGAAYGSVAEVFLKDGWTADLFEPDPNCQRILARLTAKYGSQVRLFPYAAADLDREGVPFHQNATAGLSGLAPSPFGATVQALMVRAVRLDSFLAANKVARVDLLKIDTEGNDFAVLESFDWQHLSPPLVFVEYSYFFPGQDQSTLRFAIGRMQTRGYAAVIFEYNDDGNFMRGSWNHRLVAVHLDNSRIPDRPQAFGNVLFYRSNDVHLLESLIRVIRSGS